MEMSLYDYFITKGNEYGKLSFYGLCSNKHPEIVKVVTKLMKNNKIVLNNNNDINGLKNLLEIHSKTKYINDLSYIIDRLILALDKAWNSDWYRATDILKGFYYVKFPEKIDKLKKIKNKTNLLKEKSHYDWAKEYVPRSPLLMIKNIIKLWEK
jgi:hypothetical protein